MAADRAICPASARAGMASSPAVLKRLQRARGSIRSERDTGRLSSLLCRRVADRARCLRRCAASAQTRAEPSDFVASIDSLHRASPLGAALCLPRRSSMHLERVPAYRPAASPRARVYCTGARGKAECFRRRLPPRARAAAPARPRRRRRRRRSWRPRRPRASAWRLDARRRLQAARRRRRARRGGARVAPGEPERAARWAPRRRWVGPGSGPAPPAAPRRSVPCGVCGGLWRRRGAPDPVRVRPVSPL